MEAESIEPEATLEALERALSESVVGFRVGMEGQGSQAFVDVLDAVGAVLQDPTAHGLAPGSLEQVPGLFEPMLAAQQRGDFLHLADILQYQLGPLLLGPVTKGERS